jgi:phosphatidylserine/phosphatidylglycerophosphate/cardiolipin synthase-like enzyme
LAFFASNPHAFSNSDAELASLVGLVSAEQVAMVKRAFVENGHVEQRDFASALIVDRGALTRWAANLEGVATYLGLHHDRDDVRLVMTEPGQQSALRAEIARRHAISPLLYQTTDTFINLARGARKEFVVLVPFMDDQGVEFLLNLFSVCQEGVRLILICRPLSEPHCGVAFHRQAAAFSSLGVLVYEYALPSPLPSGRETFHAKVILADDTAYYVGSSNFMGSALERSLECGVYVRGDSARQLHSVLEALIAVAHQVKDFAGRETTAAGRPFQA